MYAFNKYVQTENMWYENKIVQTCNNKIHIYMLINCPRGCHTKPDYVNSFACFSLQGKKYLHPIFHIIMFVDNIKCYGSNINFCFRSKLQITCWQSEISTIFLGTLFGVQSSPCSFQFLHFGKSYIIPFFKFYGKNFGLIKIPERDLSWGLPSSRPGLSRRCTPGPRSARTLSSYSTEYCQSLERKSFQLYKGI